jgi:hypothetical protein
MTSETKSQPLKRSKALVPYSREHHHTLLFVWKIRAGIRNKVSADRMTQYFMVCHRQNMLHHFEEEEQRLFPFFEENHPMRARAESDHVLLKAKIRDIENGAMTTSGLLSFADLLESHIRFEERELFKLIQASPDANRLRTAFEENTYTETSWEDKFWETAVC